jgi:hypothetical protein
MDEDKYNASNQLTQKIIYIYDSRKLLSEKQYYWGNGNIYRKETLIYPSEESGNSEMPSKLFTLKYKNKEPFFDRHVAFEGYNSYGDYYDQLIYDEYGDVFEHNERRYDDYGNLSSALHYKLIKRKIVIEAEATLAVIEWSDEEDSETPDNLVDDTAYYVPETVDMSNELNPIEEVVCVGDEDDRNWIVD